MAHVLVYSDEVANAEYSPTHPFKPVRARLFLELLNRYYHIYGDGVRIERPERLDEEVLYLFHDRSYIQLLKKAQSGEFELEMLQAGLGNEENPIFPGMYDLALTIAGGTHRGAELLLNRAADMAFNPIGGLHHAARDHAEGFCYVNDIAVTIKDLVMKDQRIAYVDIDAHHGDGVQNAFYDTDQVLTISLHESGHTLFPGTGFENEVGIANGRGYNVNVPLHAGTDDEVYLFAFRSIVPQLLDRFKPDIVFAQIGTDTHRDDPLAHLNLTSNGYKEVVRMIRQHSPKVLAMGGGGYNMYKTAALWALAWSVLTETEPEDKFTGLVGGMMYGPESDAGSLEDLPFVLEGAEKDVCVKEAERIVRYIERHVFPVHGL
jgi:acetoin utilization protein AcuC